MSRGPHKLIPSGFVPVPSLELASDVEVLAEPSPALDATAILVTDETDTRSLVGLGREDLAAAGFDGKAGGSVLLFQDARPVALVALGPADEVTATSLRSAAAVAARVTAKAGGRLGLHVPDLPVDAESAGRALTEGALLARYRYSVLKSDPRATPLDRLEIVVPSGWADEVTQGSDTAMVTVRSTTIARDLANTPPGHLTPTDMANVAVELGSLCGFEVEGYGRDRLIELGCGGILGVGSGSAEEPRMIVLTYEPDGEPDGHLGLIGKGITYDSGGISLKPSDPMHLLMKMDMGGAAAVLGAFAGLRARGVRARVTGWLMCTENMPSGTAYKLGDVLTARGGRTVEVKNTDAEGRLAMMDAFDLANEAGVDAMVDIATLTGAALMALGKSIAAVIGNDDAMVDRVRAAAEVADESVWRLPLERRYRKQLDSDVADIANLGGPYAGAITAALFLAEFAGATPWAHVDIAGTMSSESDEEWRSVGATGYGARLLQELALNFSV